MSFQLSTMDSAKARKIMHDETITQPSSLGHPRKPTISLVLCSRGDEYQGNSLWRLQTALNYLGKTVYELGRQEDVEVIVADWGSETPLRNLLKLTTEAAKLVSFMLIPPEIARREQMDSPFPE